MILDFVREQQPALVESLSEPKRRRIAGLGVAAPFQLWTWEAEIGAPAGRHGRHGASSTRRGEIAAVCPYPVTLCNDATAACAAEFFFGSGWRHRDFLYFFLGAFIGGGVVLDGALRIGRTGNAGAIGSMPVAQRSEGHGAPQLIACASIYQLERRLADAGVDASSIWATPHEWAEFGAALDDWIEETAAALAYASVAAISVIDFEAIVIDGEMPASVRDRLIARTAQVFEGLDRRGLSDVAFAPGHDRRRRGRDWRGGPAAGQGVRPRPRGPAQGRRRRGELTRPPRSEDGAGTESMRSRVIVPERVA